MEPEELLPGILFFTLLIIGGAIAITGIVYTCTKPEKETVNVTTFEREFYDTESDKTFVITVSVNERKK